MTHTYPAAVFQRNCNTLLHGFSLANLLYFAYHIATWIKFSIVFISYLFHYAAESLLKPGFLLDLFKKLSLKSEMFKESFCLHVPLLKNLPIVPIPWPLCQIATIDSSLANHHQTSIIKWAERYELLFSLGYYGSYEVYFIPLLATEFLGEDSSYEWLKGDEEDHWYNKTDANILYALLKFSALDFFFHSLLTEILKDVVNGVQQHSSYKCYIKIGCMEAIMPVHVPDVNSNINVYLKYHRLQNVIEFRTR